MSLPINEDNISTGGNGEEEDEWGTRFCLLKLTDGLRLVVIILVVNGLRQYILLSEMEWVVGGLAIKFWEVSALGKEGEEGSSSYSQVVILPRWVGASDAKRGGLSRH